jgi:DNA-binding MarR family transcriptional regulator
MAVNGLQQPSSEQVLLFVQHLTEIVAHVRSAPPEEVLQLRNQLHGMRAAHKPQLIANPATFYRMGAMLYQTSDVTMGELSRAISVPFSTATRMVTLWVDSGYARRLSDPNDRRIVRVVLTDRGRRLHEAIENHIAQGVQRILSCLTSEEQTILLTLLGRVASALRSGAQ